MRMSADHETEHRARKQRALEAAIKEKRGELDRVTLQFQSLERIDAEQRAQIEKLSNAA